VVESSKTHVIPFNIFKDSKYHNVKVGSDQKKILNLNS
jgi:hypothetical protein